MRPQIDNLRAQLCIELLLSKLPLPYCQRNSPKLKLSTYFVRILNGLLGFIYYVSTYINFYVPIEAPMPNTAL